jgi:hypothetical protein
MMPWVLSKRSTRISFPPPLHASPTKIPPPHLLAGPAGASNDCCVVFRQCAIPERPPQRYPPSFSARTTASTTQLSLLWLVLVAFSSGLISIPSTPQFLLHTGEGGGWEMAQGNKIDVVVLSAMERATPVVLVHPRYLPP